MMLFKVNGVWMDLAAVLDVGDTDLELFQEESTAYRNYNEDQDE